MLAEVALVLKPGGMFLFDTINRNPLARFAAITIAENTLRLLPKGTHDPDLFIKPKELRLAIESTGLVLGPTTGLGPRGFNRRGDLVFGPLPMRSIIYMGIAEKKAAKWCSQHFASTCVLVRRHSHSTDVFRRAG